MVLLVPVAAPSDEDSGLQGPQHAAGAEEEKTPCAKPETSDSGQVAPTEFMHVTEVEDVASFLELGALQERSLEWRRHPTRVVTDQTCPNALYVAQKEYAAISRCSPVTFLGSDDATTCHFLYLSSGRGEKLGLAHVDCGDAVAAEALVNSLIEDVQDIPSWLLKLPEKVINRQRCYIPTEDAVMHCCLIGGYRSPNADEVSLAVLQALARRPERIVLQLCSISTLNSCLWTSDGEKVVESIVQNSTSVPPNMQIGPAVTGCVWEVQRWQEGATGVLDMRMMSERGLSESLMELESPPRESTPVSTNESVEASASHSLISLWPTSSLPVSAAFDKNYRGPVLQLRSCRCMMSESYGRSFVESMDEETGVVRARIKVEPFYIQEWPNIRSFLRLPDAQLLQIVSTSPTLEQDRFPNDMRETMKCILHYGDASNAGESFTANSKAFPSGSPLYFSFPDEYEHQTLSHRPSAA